MLGALSLRPKGQIIGSVVSQLIFDSPHVLDFVGTCIGSRSDRLVVLDAEVDPRDGILARHHSYLVGRLV